MLVPLLDSMASSSNLIIRALRSGQRQRQRQAQPYCLDWRRTLNIFSIFSKEAVKKERLRLADELNRGYFEDYRDIKKHGGKLFVAGQSLLPISAGVKFPNLVVRSKQGKVLSLPDGDRGCSNKDETSHTRATLICMAFRFSAQPMIKSWSLPFGSNFKEVEGVQLFQVSYVDSWFLSIWPIRWLLLRAMKEDKQDLVQYLYAFGDSYDLRKTLQLTNLLTGFVLLLDKEGRVRWRSCGFPSEEEISHMISCTNQLLRED